MAVTVLYFGKLMDVAGCASETLDLPDDIRDTGALTGWLEARNRLDGALSAPTIRVAVNDAILAGPAPVRDGDEVAYMPPVGGG